jgi:hypothetical protein
MLSHVLGIGCESGSKRVLWGNRDAKASRMINRYLYIGWDNGICCYGGDRMKYTRTDMS